MIKKSILYSIIILMIFSCKSTENTKNNQLDTTTVKAEDITNKVQVTQITLDEFEITLHTADKKKPVYFTDEKGNKKTFENVKKINLKKKSEIKKDSTVSNQSQKKETIIDKSKIKETAKSISDTNNYKWIFISIAIIVGFGLIGYLVFKFKK